MPRYHNNMPSPRQALLLLELAVYQAKHARSPTLKELGHIMGGRCMSTINDTLLKLASRGLIELGPGRPRKIMINLRHPYFKETAHEDEPRRRVQWAAKQAAT